MLLAMVLASTMGQSPKTLALFKGAALEGQHIRYWDVTDTVIDSAQPDVNLGGEYSMSSGTGKVILIKFGNLDRAVGSARKVKHARLVFSYASTEKPVLNSIGQVLVPWGEGPILTLSSARMALPKYDSDGKVIETKALPPPKWSATWRQRRAGEIGWQQNGASGPADVRPIEGAKLVQINDHEFAIEGIDHAVQAMVDRWYENDGFALKLDSPTEIASSQSPEGRPRLELDLDEATPAKGPDLSVALIEHTSAGGYVAHVKNVGDAPSEGFTGSWSLHEKGGSSVEVPQTIPAGGEFTMNYTAPLKPNALDHITDPVGFRIHPKGPDASAANDYLEVQQNALELDFEIDPAVATKIASYSTSLEDWVQGQIRTLNDEVLSQSRYSFAALGVLERVRVGRISIGQPEGLNSFTVASIKPEGVTVRGPEDVTPMVEVCQAFLRKQLRYPVDSVGYKVALKDATQLDGSGQSRFPGIVGWGDTEGDGAIASQINLGYQAVFSPIFEGLRLEPTDLVPATLVSLINRSLSGGYKPEKLTEMPRTVLVRALDFNGFELKNTELSFYPCLDGSVADGPPGFSLTTSAGATVLLPSKEAGTGQANPFGALKNLHAAYLVKATSNEATAWAWLPAWELFDSASRGNIAATVFDLYFNLPNAVVDTEVNLAKNKILTDSTNRLPAQLAALVDQDPTSTSTLGGKAGDWVEIDLGRDRPIGEVRLSFKGADFWKRFDLVTYATGQRVDDGITWSREMDLDWSLTNRSNDLGGGTRFIAYRGVAQRFRFLRIVNKIDSAKAELAEIQVFAAKPTP